MNIAIPKNTTSRILLNIAALVVVIAGMTVAKSMIVLLLLASFIAIIAAQPLFWLQKKGIPNWLALIIVILGVFLLIVALVSLVGASINNFNDRIPEYEARLNQQITMMLDWIEKLGFEIPGLNDVSQSISPGEEIKLTDKLLIGVKNVINPGGVMKLTGKLLNGIANALTNAFLIFMIVIFILLEAASFPNKMAVISPDEDTSQTGRADEFINTVNQYMAIKTIVSMATGLIVFGFLSILGVDFALLWGILAFMLNYVPNIGSIIAAVPAVLLTIIQFGLLKALIVAIGYIAVNLIMGNAVEPRFMGKGLGLSTLVVFLSLLVWGWILGPVGMLLSVPLTITAKIALDSREDSRWISVLLGPDPGKPKKEALPEEKEEIQSDKITE